MKNSFLTKRLLVKSFWRYISNYTFIIDYFLIFINKKNSALKTVVNKVGKIETTFRTFQMEVIAGEDQLETQVVNISIL